MADLAGMFFFTMRSCEYSTIPECGKTKLLTIGNIRVYSKDRIEISHHDQLLESRAEYITITFEDQKNNKKMETRTQRRMEDPIPCSVTAWARIVSRILTSPGTSLSTTVNFFFDSTATEGSQ